MTSAIKIVAILEARAGKAEDLRALLFGMAASCRAESGNLRWDIWKDRSAPDRYVLDELYVDAEAVAAHRETPHYKNYLGKINDLAERVAVVGDPADVA
jgi:quinol monooxygenase YgiN